MATSKATATTTTFHALRNPSTRMYSAATLITARTAGLIYLAIIGLGLFGEVVVRASLVVSGDAGATALGLLNSELLWRAGISADLVMHVLDVPLIVFFYLLLKPVSHPLALLATAFNLVQTCILGLNKLLLVAALAMLKSAHLSAWQGDPEALAFLAIGLHSHGFAIGLIFFGFACLVRGHLMVRSGHVPPVLGILLGIAGASYLANSFALLLVPALAAVLFPAVLVPAFIGELAVSLWLLFQRNAQLQQRVSGRRWA